MKNLFGKIKLSRGIKCGIYCLTVKNHKYIGSSEEFVKRFHAHRSMLRRGKHDNIYLQRAYDKYKEVYFSILQIIDPPITRRELRSIEKSWVLALNADLNLDDPVVGIGGNILKRVYQYSMDGEFIREWESSLEIQKELNIPYWRIHSAANPNTRLKATENCMWRYIKEEKPVYVNNLGINLEKKEIHLYSLKGEYLRSYISLSECARELSRELGYEKNWTNIRSTIFYAANSPKTRTIRKQYKASYIKTENLMVS